MMNPLPEVESSSEADPHLSQGGILQQSSSTDGTFWHWWNLPALMELRLLGHCDSGLASSAGPTLHADSGSLASLPLFSPEKGESRAELKERAGGRVFGQLSVSPQGRRWCYFHTHTPPHTPRGRRVPTAMLVRSWAGGLGFACALLQARRWVFEWQWGEGQVRWKDVSLVCMGCCWQLQASSHPRLPYQYPSPWAGRTKG